DVSSGNLVTVGYMTVIGVAMGLMMPTYLTAIQNAVERSALGVATAVNMFFRSIGGTFAVAIFGTVLTRRLATELPARLGDSAQLVSPQRLLQSPAEAHRLPAHLVDGARGALAASLHTV